MNPLFTEAPVAILVLTCGDHLDLVQRALDSILQFTAPAQRRIVVGANAVGRETERYLRTLQEQNALDHVVFSETNLGKCPMMRRMFECLRPPFQSEFIWWFDDDSFVTSATALPERLQIARSAPPETVMWGERYMCKDPVAFSRDDPVRFVRSAPWYRGLPPPFWAPGGKGVLEFNGKPSGDGRWIFLVGAGWFARSAALFAMDWPDRRVSTFGEDVFLGEAIRQQGWQIEHVGKLGVEINAAPRRWNLAEDQRRAEALQAAH